MDETQKVQVGREIHLHSQMHHPNIIPIWAVWKDDDFIYMAMEWAESVRDLPNIYLFRGPMHRNLLATFPCSGKRY